MVVLGAFVPVCPSQLHLFHFFGNWNESLFGAWVIECYRRLVHEKFCFFASCSISLLTRYRSRYRSRTHIEIKAQYHSPKTRRKVYLPFSPLLLVVTKNLCASSMAYLGTLSSTRLETYSIQARVPVKQEGRRVLSSLGFLVLVRGC